MLVNGMVNIVFLLVVKTNRCIYGYLNMFLLKFKMKHYYLQ